MLFNWLRDAIREVEGAAVDSETFESGYFTKYQDHLEKASSALGWPAEQQATAYGSYQILGENLARFHGLGIEHLDRFLSDPQFQDKIARKQFYLMLKSLIKRRGMGWPHYIYSMWNAGVNYNETYTRRIKAAMRKGR